MTVLGGGVAAVVAAIQDEVDAEIEKRRKDLDTAIATVDREAPLVNARSRDESARLLSAREEARERLAREDWLDSREAIQQREEWLQRVAGEGLRRLREDEIGPEGPESLFELAAEGISRLPGDACEVAVSESASARIDTGWCARLQRRCGKRDVRLVSAENGNPDGGCVVRTPDGRFSFDNSLAARSRRFEAVWRSALIRLYG